MEGVKPPAGTCCSEPSDANASKVSAGTKQKEATPRVCLQFVMKCRPHHPQKRPQIVNNYCFPAFSSLKAVISALDDLCIMTITSGDICTKPRILSLKLYHGGKSLQAFYIMSVICVKILTFGPLGKAINLSNI